MTIVNHRYQSILETIGNTPVVQLQRLAPPGILLYAKLESFNPMGSVKDRMALAVIEHAEQTGALKPGQTVIEATSGNTGIGLAMVCAAKGYPLVIVMSENFSLERRKMLRFLGAKVVLTPAAERGTGMIRKVGELAAKHGWFQTRQFENEINAEVHSRTTAREIIAAFENEKLDYWITGYGTGGTVKGVSRVLRKERPGTRIVVCEPDNSAMLASGIPQPFDESGVRTSHPVAKPHPIQGIGPDFIPKLVEDAIRDGLVDEIVPVNGGAALDLAHQLASREGIFCGISGGATLAAAFELARRVPEGSTMLCMLPDTGERYMSTPLFEQISIEMNDEELAIANSTPSCRIAAVAPVATPAAEPVAEVVEITEDASAFVRSVLSDTKHPVVMFALEWCEYCWALRKMLTAVDIEFRSIDLDSVAYQGNDRGIRIRAALQQRTGIRTIPQVFVGGELIGGCNEVFDAWRDRKLQGMLSEAGVTFRDDRQLDPYSFLPNWQASRA